MRLRLPRLKLKCRLSGYALLGRRRVGDSVSEKDDSQSHHGDCANYQCRVDANSYGCDLFCWKVGEIDLSVFAHGFECSLSVYKTQEEKLPRESVIVYTVGMAKKTNPVQIQVQVTLTPDAYNFLEANAKGDLAGTLAGWCGYWCSQQAGGGIMLDPVDHQYLADLNGGKKFKDSRSLVTAVEKGLKRDSGLHSFIVSIDPTYYPLFQEHAKNSGLTEEECIDGIVQYILSTGMVYEWTPTTGRNIPFSFDMIQRCAALCDKHKIDSTDIAGLIAEERLLPVSREMRAKMKALVPDKLDFTAGDLGALLDELIAARVELADLRTAPRELVAA